MSAVTIPLTPVWQRVALAGQSVIIQNQGGYQIVLTTSSATPSTNDGVDMAPNATRNGVLVADLYARSDFGGSVLIATDFFTGTGTVTVTPTPANSNLHPTFFGFGLLGAATN